MIEKALIIIIFMYCSSFGLLSAQYLWGDMLGVTLRNQDGVAIGESVQTIIHLDKLNSGTQGITSLNQTGITTNPITTAANLTWGMVQILTGTYIFSVLSLFGIPGILVAGITIIYSLLLFRAIIGYLRGI